MFTEKEFDKAWDEYVKYCNSPEFEKCWEKTGNYCDFLSSLNETRETLESFFEWNKKRNGGK